MNEPLVVSETSLSVAWARAFLALMEKGASMRTPAVISINGIEDGHSLENSKIRTALDETLKKNSDSSCATVANTIFPQSMWNPNAENDAALLYQRYEKAWEGIKKCPQNRNGVYFRRLAAYHPKGSTAKPTNQLQFIVENYAGGNHRKSAMQAAILDPTRDHTANRQKGFPCMQQVAFTPLKNDGLTVTGYYATQYVFEKAYGNYLGLLNLGRFMGKQMGMELRQVVCIASVLSRGAPTKEALDPLALKVSELLKIK